MNARNSEMNDRNGAKTCLLVRKGCERHVVFEMYKKKTRVEEGATACERIVTWCFK